VSIENVKANAALARSATDIGRKLDFLACAIEEMANVIDRTMIVPLSSPPESEPTPPAEESESGSHCA